MNWWIAFAFETGGAVLVVSWIFWIVFSICLHELAHGWAAIWQGDDTPRRLGHMTMNPMVHMGPWSLLWLVLVGIAWGAMPVDPSRFRWRRKGRIVVAGAGPAMNVALALVALTAATLWGVYGSTNVPDVHNNVELFLWTGGWLNLALAFFNLLPIPPLDGGNIMMGVSFRYYRLMQSDRAQMIAMLIFLAIFFSGVAGRIFVGAMWVSGAYVKFLAELLI